MLPPADQRWISLLNALNLPTIPSPTTSRRPWFDLFSSRAYRLLPWLTGVPVSYGILGFASP